MGGLRAYVGTAVLALALIEAGGCAGSGSMVTESAEGSPRDRVPPAPSRLAAIERAIVHGRGRVFRRALQESAAYVGESPRLCRLVLDQACRRSGYAELGAYTDAYALAALVGARGESVREVIGAYAGADAAKRPLLRRVLGRMGAEAAAAASMLRQDLAALAAGPEARMEIKVVLASIGAAGRPELDEIAQCIRERNGGGRAALSAMADIGRCEWWSQGIREAIVAALDESAANTYRQDGSELPVLAILALGNLGPGADSDVKSLLARVTDMGRMVSDAGSPDLAFWWIAGALSLARVDADRRTELLSQPLFSYENGETFQVLESQCADLTDPGFVRAVTSLLASTSPGVVMHAANILGAIGPPAQGATPELLRLVDSAREERVRVAAARALGMVAPPSAAYALRLWSQRSHGRVKRALDESIQAIELAVVP